MKWKWDTTMMEVAQEVAAEHGLTVEQVKEAVNKMMKAIRDAMMLPSVPKIYLHKFGTFWGDCRRLFYREKKLRKSENPEDHKKADETLAIRTRITTERYNMSNSLKKKYAARRNSDARQRNGD